MLKILILCILIIILMFYVTELIIKIVMVAILTFIIWVYYTNYLENFANILDDGINSKEFSSFTDSFDQSPNFINFDLSKKPRSNNESYPIYWWWKNIYNDSLNQQYKNCDQYGCYTKSLNGYVAKPGFNLINGKYKDPTAQMQNVIGLNFGINCNYYGNPTEFCNKYPGYELCPNNWINDKHSTRNNSDIGFYHDKKIQC